MSHVKSSPSTPIDLVPPWTVVVWLRKPELDRTVVKSLHPLYTYGKFLLLRILKVTSEVNKYSIRKNVYIFCIYFVSCLRNVSFENVLVLFEYLIFVYLSMLLLLSFNFLAIKRKTNSTTRLYLYETTSKKPKVNGYDYHCPWHNTELSQKCREIKLISP